MKQQLKRIIPMILLGGLLSAPVSAENVTAKAVITNYVDLAAAGFSDAWTSSKILQQKIAAFIDKPSEDTLQAAKQAWLLARTPYSQTEVFRFGNPNVDDWEGQVNAWPLDEGLIDYVQTETYEHEEGNQFATENVIAGKEVINETLLRGLQEKGGSEANVALGYHAIEFLLWGQDANEKPQDAGKRPYTDFVQGEGCTNGNCDRRAQYLTVVTDLLVSDLETMANDWVDGKDNYRKAFLALNEKEALRRILLGMGSLSLAELAGERMNVALLANSQEDEHSCFSDNTHNDIAENALGIQNVYTGSYQRVDGSKVVGASLAQLLAAKNQAASEALLNKLITTQQAAQAIVDAAVAGEPFDQQILPSNKVSNERIKTTITALRSQTSDIEKAATILGIDNLSAEIQ